MVVVVSLFRPCPTYEVVASAILGFDMLPSDGLANKDADISSATNGFGSTLATKRPLV